MHVLNEIYKLMRKGAKINSIVFFRDIIDINYYKDNANVIYIKPVEVSTTHKEYNQHNRYYTKFIEILTIKNFIEVEQYVRDKYVRIFKKNIGNTKIKVYVGKITRKDVNNIFKTIDILLSVRYPYKETLIEVYIDDKIVFKIFTSTIIEESIDNVPSAKLIRMKSLEFELLTFKNNINKSYIELVMKKLIENNITKCKIIIGSYKTVIVTDNKTFILHNDKLIMVAQFSKPIRFSFVNVMIDIYENVMCIRKYESTSFITLNCIKFKNKIRNILDKFITNYASSIDIIDGHVILSLNNGSYLDLTDFHIFSYLVTISKCDGTFTINKCPSQELIKEIFKSI